MSVSSSSTMMVCFTKIVIPRFLKFYNDNHESTSNTLVCNNGRCAATMNFVILRTTTLRLLVVLAVFVSTFSGIDGSSPALPPVPATVDSITPTELRMHLDFLASKELGGRYTLAPNFAIAARYLASHLKAYGFHGAGPNGDFLQFFDVASTKADLARTTLALTINGQTSNYKYGDFFSFRGGVDADVQGPIVFVGYGISSPSQNYDDYSGVDVKGKLVLVAGGSPEGVEASKLGEKERGESAARAHGAIGVLILPGDRTLNSFRDKNFRERAVERESVGLARENDPSVLPLVALGPELAEKILAPIQLDPKKVNETARAHGRFTPKSLDVSAHLVLAAQKTKVVTQNVTGILGGTEPEPRKGYGVLSVHYAHLQAEAQAHKYPRPEE